ncbi:YeeE/YedE family protein [Geobacter pickeringii]|uniref:Uncharacterized protein n=1 Tax=Geobacter pickeringii TaxID=345632 RepID=A0A0B5B8D2_9BACT|nr:YeeE/YedE family protein [Geobacter pickeringii]AJE02817.1 hypothetical protein GPICK_05065 [Geobacter pickeringii]
MFPANLPLIAMGLLLGGVAGFAMHRADFCMAGAFRDIFLFRRTVMLRPLLLLVTASMVLFEVARLAGWLPLYPFPLLGTPSVANLAGGFAFGIGMVLAGGCVAGTLYRAGAGSVTAVAALVGLVTGSALFAAIHPWWKRFADATALPALDVTIPRLAGVEPYRVIVPLAAAAALLFLHWRRKGLWSRPAIVEGYLQPWKAALILAVIGLCSAVATTMPLGITTSYAKGGAWLASLWIPGWVEGAGYFRTLPLDLAAVTPLGHVPLRGGPAPVTDALALVQIPVIAGIVGGSALSALLIGEFRLYVRLPARHYLSALAGGTVMGVAARMAPSCNIWHLAGGVPILAWQSILFTGGLLPGAWLGGVILTRFVTKR